MTDHIFDNEANNNSNGVTQIVADIDRPPPFFNAIAIATVVLEVWALQGNQIKMQKVRSWSRGMLCVQVSIAVALWSSPPCNRARPLRPRSRPCHHTWERGVTLLCWFLRCFCLIFVVLFACLIPEGQESENRVKMDKRPGCLRKTTRSSTGTRELVRTAGCKQWSWWRRLVFSTRAVKLVSSIVTIWSSVTPKNRTKMMIKDVHHHQDSTLWEPRYKPPPLTLPLAGSAHGCTDHDQDNCDHLLVTITIRICWRFWRGLSRSLRWLSWFPNYWYLNFCLHMQVYPVTFTLSKRNSTPHKKI